MKKLTVLLCILMFTFVVVSSVSCIKEAGRLCKRFVTNSSAHALELVRYGHSGSEVDTIDTSEEYMFFAEEDHFGYDGFGIAPFDNVEDSIVIRFDDGKKIVYTLLPDSVNMYKDSIFMNTKNIYLGKFYQTTKIATDEERFHIYEERFYITPEDYKLAK